jgi:putative restriction endonuclease
MIAGVGTDGMSEAEVLARLSSLRQHRRAGQRSPHKPLLVLYALGQLMATRSSALAWPTAAEKLAELIRDYGPPSATPTAQRAAYPFTRLRSDEIWTLDHDVPMDRVRPLSANHVIGRLEPRLEKALRDPHIAAAAARQLVEAEFPPTVAPDVLVAVGLDPGDILSAGGSVGAPRQRRRSWAAAVLTAWNRQCAFCGFDGQLGGATVGVEAAHVRWFTSAVPTTRTTVSLCAHCTTSCSIAVLSASTSATS